MNICSKGEVELEKERLRLMVKVCQLYYQEGINQQEIAKRYGISRPQVSRLITAAKSEGIVEINVRNPFGKETTLEKKLIKHFNLKDAIVVDTSNLDSEASYTSLAIAGSVYFESVVNDNDIVGVMAGKSITAIANELNDIKRSGIHFVPLVGGWGLQGVKWHANTNVTQFARKARGEYWLLHAPAYVSSIDIHKTLLEEPQIKKVIDLANQANIALVGIGQISENATFFKSMNITQEELKEIKKEGTVGSIGTSFINSEGAEVGINFSRRMLGITGENLRKVPLVIGFASGASKVDAIHASLKGKWLNVLITDMETANEILKKENLEEDLI